MTGPGADVLLLFREQHHEPGFVSFISESSVDIENHADLGLIHTRGRIYRDRA